MRESVGTSELASAKQKKSLCISKFIEGECMADMLRREESCESAAVVRTKTRETDNTVTRYRKLQNSPPFLIMMLTHRENNQMAFKNSF